ncbi:hypothetical protein Tco_0388340 [Tanacetum coccineum]
MLRLQRLGSNTETGVPYTEEEIMAIVRKGKQRGHWYRISTKRQKQCQNRTKPSTGLERAWKIEAEGVRILVGQPDPC